MGVNKAREKHGFRWEPLDVEAAAALSASSSVAVMAPALTEGGPQKPENLLNSLPAGGFLSSDQATEVCQNREVLAKFVVSANVQPTKIDERCLRGISKDLIHDVINSKYGRGIDNLSVFANGSDLIVDKDELAYLVADATTIITTTKATTTRKTREHIIMNDPSMGDQPDNSMGFLKTCVDVPMARAGSDESSDDKMASGATGNLDVDQMMGFTSEQCNMASVPDIGQNVEEILRAIKSMEGGNDGGDGADGVAQGGAEAPASTGDAAEMFPMAEEGFSSFERELLNDVDVIGLCNENDNDNINIAEAVETQRSNDLRAQHEMAAQRQFETERRCAFLLRRLRKLQARIVGGHAAEENMGVLEAAHTSAKKYLYQELQDMGNKSNVRNFPDVSSSLGSFLHKIEKTCAAQSNSANRQRASCRYFGAGSRDSAATSGSGANRHPVFGVPRVRVKSDDVESVAGPLATQLGTVHRSLDSDCTASSSGGESADEMQAFNSSHQQRLPM